MVTFAQGCESKPSAKVKPVFKAGIKKCTHLLHIQGHYARQVAHNRLPDHCLIELHLRCDVCHLHRIEVVISNVQSVLKLKKQGTSLIPSRSK